MKDLKEPFFLKAHIKTAAAAKKKKNSAEEWTKEADEDNKGDKWKNKHIGFSANMYKWSSYTYFSRDLRM